MNTKLPQIDKALVAGKAGASMVVAERIEAALDRSLRLCETPSTPQRLRAAMRHAVFPGGARLRPGLALSVAAACDPRADLEREFDPSDDPAAEAAAAIELLHCASLVHDDLPCFDDAAVRRGRPSVHKVFGEELAVLAGDGLIVLAFDVVARARVDVVLVPRLVRCIAQGVGACGGLVAGQAWESEQSVGLRTYHKAKTGALFEAGARVGALVANVDPDPWARFGARLGEAYQVADDLRDTLDDETSLGKPVGQDMVHDRPNACISLGIDGALDRLRKLIDQAIEAMPTCPHPDRVVEWVDGFGARLYPRAVHVGPEQRSANQSMVADLRA